MGFAFIHTADWQIGKPFGAFPDETAALLRAARLDAVDRVASAALAVGARHILVAGDVFDHARPDQRTVRQLLSRLEEQRVLAWHLLPGNHDPAQPGGVWDTIATGRLPTNVFIHTTPTPAEIEPGVLLLPAPLTARATSIDPTGYMDQFPSPPGKIRIGIAHGSVRGFSSEGEAAIPIDIGRAGKARLDYLALGDWHGLQQIDARSWYSGTHEPDGYKDNNPGHVLAVTVSEHGAIPSVRPMETGQYTWLRKALALSGVVDLERFAADFAANGKAKARQLLKLDLSGRLPLGDFASIRERLTALGDGLAHLSADLSGIEVTTAAEDLAAFGDGSIGVIAARLAALRNADDAAGKSAAALALRKLASLAGTAP